MQMTTRNVRTINTKGKALGAYLLSANNTAPSQLQSDSVFAYSAQGISRVICQDRAFVVKFDEFSLYSVLDGLAPLGHVIAEKLAEALIDVAVLKKSNLASNADLLEHLKTSVARIDSFNLPNEGVGSTTIAMAIVFPNGVYNVFSLGDSSAYTFGEKPIALFNPNEKIGRGVTLSIYNKLLNVVPSFVDMSNGVVSIQGSSDLSSGLLEKGQKLFLCTDGITKILYVKLNPELPNIIIDISRVSDLEQIISSSDGSVSGIGEALIRSMAIRLNGKFINPEFCRTLISQDDHSFVIAGH